MRPCILHSLNIKRAKSHNFGVVSATVAREESRAPRVLHNKLQQHANKSNNNISTTAAFATLPKHTPKNIAETLTTHSAKHRLLHGKALLSKTISERSCTISNHTPCTAADAHASCCCCCGCCLLVAGSCSSCGCGPSHSRSRSVKVGLAVLPLCCVQRSCNDFIFCSGCLRSRPAHGSPWVPSSWAP